MASDKLKAQEDREMYILKQRALQYYTDNGVPEKIEQILNSTFYDNPSDVYGHLANYFEKFVITPTVTQISVRDIFDGIGRPAFELETFCKIKNFDKLVASTTSTCQTIHSDPFAVKAEEKEEFEEAIKSGLADIRALLEGEILSIATGYDPQNQRDYDDQISSVVNEQRAELVQKIEEEKAAAKELESPVEHQSPPASGKGKKKPSTAKGKGGKGKEVVIIPDEEKEPSVCGCAALSLASQAMCETAAALTSTPIYQHVAKLKFEELPETLSLPLPMSTILCGGKHLPGKFNYVYEYMLVPRPDMPFSEAYGYLIKIYQHCAQTMSAKTGAITRNVNEFGALCGNFDRIEQGLDLLQEAITAVGLTPAEDFNIALQLGGPATFDYDKGKYEIATGGLKSAEELSDYLGDIVTRYPSIIALIDPMRRVEREAWMKLCERVTESCHVLCDNTSHRPGRFVEEEILPEWRASGNVVKMTGENTLSQLLDASNKSEENEMKLVVGTALGNTSTFAADLAVGLQARFIKLGAPMRFDHVALYNRLRQIEDALKEGSQLGTPSAHVFTLIKLPTPPPTPPAEEGAGEGSPAAQDKKV